MIVLLIIIIIIGLVFWLKSKEKKKMKEKGCIAQLTMIKHISGIQGLADGSNAKLELYPDKLLIQERLTITLDRIRHAEVLRENQITEKQKSVIGRAVVGGVLLGPLGAIVGGISGTGKKQKRKEQFFLSLDYVTVDGNNECAVFTSPLYNQMMTFKNKLNGLAQATSTYEV